MGELIIAVFIGGCMAGAGLIMRLSLLKERRDLMTAAAPELKWRLRR
ncbi:MAG: hypothetical protein LBE49_00970 [Deltaproteobacteria bacterium]|jgi:hypothetical protein|nr:hypothetical protein [Deltaproteobacteria bacterium]